MTALNLTIDQLRDFTQALPKANLHALVTAIIDNDLDNIDRWQLIFGRTLGTVLRDTISKGITPDEIANLKSSFDLAVAVLAELPPKIRSAFFVLDSSDPRRDELTNIWVDIILAMNPNRRVPQAA